MMRLAYQTYAPDPAHVAWTLGELDQHNMSKRNPYAPHTPEHAAYEEGYKFAYEQQRAEGFM